MKVHGEPEPPDYVPPEDDDPANHADEPDPEEEQEEDEVPTNELFGGDPDVAYDSYKDARLEGLDPTRWGW